MDPLAPFDDGVVADAAAAAGIDAGTLETGLREHQESVRSYPGVDDLVYEWRRAMAYDPLVERAEVAYYLVVLEHVWDEFGARLEFDGELLAAVRAVHDRQARRDAAGLGVDEDVYNGAAPVVLTRE